MDPTLEMKRELFMANLANIWPIEQPPRLVPEHQLFLGDDLNRFKEDIIGDKIF